jgi:putative SbcD/Mre11-related phosphoesterase
MFFDDNSGKFPAGAEESALPPQIFQKCFKCRKRLPDCMEIHPKIEIIDLALYLKESGALVLSDLHIGFEESLMRQGVLVPRFHYKDIIDRLEQVFSKVKPKGIVLNGDLKHEFGAASRQEWKETMRLFDYLQRKCEKIVIVKGNHDPSLGPLADKKGIQIVSELKLGKILIAHGDSMPKTKNSGVIIVGHIHPAASLRDKGRVEKYKCFLKGRYKKSVLIVQPSFHPSVEGSDVTKEKVKCPLVSDFGDFDVFVVDDARKKVLAFGKVNELPQ